MEEPTIKVTRIADRYHARLLRGGRVLAEMACELKVDIGIICRELLRWHHKLGAVSEYASRARSRAGCRTIGEVKGKVWHRAFFNGKE